MGSKDSNDVMVAIQLTIDLKPDLPSVLYTLIIHPIYFQSVFLLNVNMFNFDANSYRRSRKNQTMQG